MKASASKTTEQQQLLFTRAQVARLLGCSTATVIRLQGEGRLKPIRLLRSPTSQVYFRREDVLALTRAQGGDDDAE